MKSALGGNRLVSINNMENNMNKSDSIKELAAALSKAQAMQNIHAEAILFKKFTNRGAFVNAKYIKEIWKLSYFYCLDLNTNSKFL